VDVHDHDAGRVDAHLRRRDGAVDDDLRECRPPARRARTPALLHGRSPAPSTPQWGVPYARKMVAVFYGVPLVISTCYVFGSFTSRDELVSIICLTTKAISSRIWVSQVRQCRRPFCHTARLIRCASARPS